MLTTHRYIQARSDLQQHRWSRDKLLLTINRLKDDLVCSTRTTADEPENQQAIKNVARLDKDLAKEESRLPAIKRAILACEEIFYEERDQLHALFINEQLPALKECLEPIHSTLVALNSVCNTELTVSDLIPSVMDYDNIEIAKTTTESIFETWLTELPLFDAENM